MGKTEIRVGMICCYPPEKASQGYLIMKLMPQVTGVNFIKIGSFNSNADYKVNLKSFTLAESIKALVIKENLDLLHIQYIAPFFGRYTLNLNLLPIYNLKVPVVTTIHEVQTNARSSSLYSVLKSFVLKRIQYQILKKSKVVVVNNHSMAQFLKNIYSEANIAVIPEPCSPQVNKKDKIANNIIFFGVLSPGKGVEVLLEAMNYLDGYNLCVAGSLPEKVNLKYLKKIKKIIIRDKLEKKVKLITRDWFAESEIHNLYSESDIIIMPYVWGPYNSGIIKDACEYCLPIVATDVGFISDPIRRYGLGLITPVHDPKALAAAIKEVFENYGNYVDNIVRAWSQLSYVEIANSYKLLYYNAIK